MSKPRPIRGPAQRGEEGYMLLAAMCLLVLFTISLSVAIPAITKEIQRDHEVETIERGKQYIRAIKMYYRKNGSYPPNIDALVKPSGPNNYRFLRKKYVDPLTGKDDWKPIQFGENKAPTAMGFFGQPLAGMGVGGVGPGVAGAQTLGSSLTPSSGFGSTDTSSTAGGNSSILTSSSPSDSSTPGSSSTSTAGGGSTIGGSSSGGQTMGGMGIIGFKPVSPKQAILIYKTKNHYNEWEFVYDPTTDLNTVSAGGGPAGAAPMTGGTTPGGGLTGGGTGFGSSSPGGFGSSSPGGFGSSSPGGFGSSSGNPTAPPSSNPNP